MMMVVVLVCCSSGDGAAVAGFSADVVVLDGIDGVLTRRDIEIEIRRHRR